MGRWRSSNSAVKLHTKSRIRKTQNRFCSHTDKYRARGTANSVNARALWNLFGTWWAGRSEKRWGWWLSRLRFPGHARPRREQSADCILKAYETIGNLPRPPYLHMCEQWQRAPSNSLKALLTSKHSLTRHTIMTGSPNFTARVINERARNTASKSVTEKNKAAIRDSCISRRKASRDPSVRSCSGRLLVKKPCRVTWCGCRKPSPIISTKSRRSPSGK